MDIPNLVSVDANIDLNREPVEVIHQGPTVVSDYVYKATSSSSSQIVFNNITPPSLDTVVQRTLRLKYKLQVVVDCSAASKTTAFNYPGIQFGVETASGTQPTTGDIKACLRSFPLQKCVSSLEVSINGNQTSINSADIIKCLERLVSDKDIMRFSSEFPCTPDKFAGYTHAFNPAVSATSPFAPSGAGSYLPSRAESGMADTTPVGSGGNKIWTYQFSVVETLVISPFLFGDMREQEGLALINQIALKINLGSLQRAVSLVPSTNATLAVTLSADTPELLVRYSTLPRMLSNKLPPVLAYNFDQPTAYFTNFPPNSVTLNASSLQINSIPSKIYIYAEPLPATTVNIQELPDRFAGVKKLTMQFGNRVGLLSTMEPQSLWRMSVNNGLNMSWRDWYYNTGSIIVVDVARDLGLEENDFVGMANRYSTFQYTLEIDNIPDTVSNTGTGTTQPLRLVTIINMNGKCLITKGSCEYVMNDVSPVDVSRAITSEPVVSGEVVGSGLFSSLGKKLVKLARAPAVHGVIKKGLDAMVDKKDAKGGIITGGELVKRSRHRREADY